MLGWGWRYKEGSWRGIKLEIIVERVGGTEDNTGGKSGKSGKKWEGKDDGKEGVLEGKVVKGGLVSWIAKVGGGGGGGGAWE